MKQCAMDLKEIAPASRQREETRATLKPRLQVRRHKLEGTLTMVRDRVRQFQLFLVQHGDTETRIEWDFAQIEREARAARARYVGDLLTRGCNAVVPVFSSAFHWLKRTLITASRNPGPLAKR